VPTHATLLRKVLAGLAPGFILPKRGRGMLTNYLRAAMRNAQYEILEDRTFYGEIPGFTGVYANASTLEACREELEEVLEEWILFRVSRNLGLPVVDGIELTVKEVA
jgi:predicted RNase H-like HicB family nuclease